MATDPRFNYQVPTPPVSVEQLDDFWKIVVSSGTGTWPAIIAGVKIILLSALFFARERLIAQEQLRAKQKYEQDHANQNQDEVDQGDPQ